MSRALETIGRDVERLRRFVHRRAAELTDELGFGYRPSRYAPSRCDVLCTEHRFCRCSGTPLRVSSLHGDRTVLGSKANLAFRFWHDCTHVALDAGFDHAGEIEVGQQQLAELEDSGVRPHTTTWRLLFAETIGQNECVHRLGVFPADQVRFTVDYLEHGLTEAIAREGERRRIVPAWDSSNVVHLDEVRAARRRTREPLVLDRSTDGDARGPGGAA